MKCRLTALIARDEAAYTARCPELDIVSEGPTVESARENLRLAVESFLDLAPVEEIERRLALGSSREAINDPEVDRPPGP